MPSLEKRLLQILVTLACVVPVTGGAYGTATGTHAGDLNQDSHFRYLSGLLFGIGIGFLSTVPHIERHTARFRLLTFIVFTGGAGRLAGMIMADIPGCAMQAALVMEMIVTPLLCLWQHRVARIMVSLETLPKAGKVQ